MSVSVCIIGDICLSGEVERILLARTNPNLFSALRGNGSDEVILVGTVECAVSDRGVKKPYKVCLRSSINSARLLKGLDIGLLGNNHIQDYGHIAAEDTVEAVRSVGVQPVGYGRNIQEAMTPAVMQLGDVRLAVISMCCITTRGENVATTETPGVTAISMSMLRDAIQAAKAIADLVMVCPHWGVQDERFPVSDQIRLAHRAIDWGANAVVGTHAHVVQVYEQYRNAWIFYGLGNYLFGDIHSKYVSLSGLPLERGWDIEQEARHRESLAVWLSPVRKQGQWTLELDQLRVARCQTNFTHTLTDIASLPFHLAHANNLLSQYTQRNSNWLASDSEPSYISHILDGIPVWSYSDAPIDHRRSFCSLVIRRARSVFQRLHQ